MATAKDTVPEITAITVAGFKSIARETRIEIAPLTLLAGANSSGKSSVMQPLLLLKQTLEATYDPGALLLSDSHVRFTDSSQLLSGPVRSQVSEFTIGLDIGATRVVETFLKTKTGGFDLVSMSLAQDQIQAQLQIGMREAEIRRVLNISGHARFTIVRERCFLTLKRDDLSFFVEHSNLIDLIYAGLLDLGSALRSLIHLPGLRGNPQRAYPVAAVGPSFVGPFPVYTASVVLDWQERSDIRLKTVSNQLGKLGLTWKLEARRLDATSVELRVGRLPSPRRGGASDLVNIADVGFGISQTLPVLVALLAAQPGQLVYLEQPEIHLHPRAQIVLAEILVEAARRGVKVVAETHSSLLLIAIQTLVAQGKITPDLVKLHWFQRGDDGLSTVSSADLDEAGAFGDWPEDFAEVELNAQGRYLDAAEARDLGNKPRARKTKAARR